MKTSSEQKTKQIAADFAKTLKGGEVVFLKGDLGTGKTTFVRGVAEAFGFKEPVRSPTFTIMNLYQTDNFQIVHLDFYRFTSFQEIQALGLEEYLGQKDSIVFIEWPEKGIEENKISPTHQIEFETKKDSERSIKIS